MVDGSRHPHPCASIVLGFCFGLWCLAAMGLEDAGAGASPWGPGDPAPSAVREDWARRYDGPGHDWDAQEGMALDGFGNVIITGSSEGASGNSDIVTIKYDPDGNRLWARRYRGDGDDEDEGYAVAVDGVGNVYVAGYVTTPTSQEDLILIKYRADGELLWQRRFNGTGNGYDSAYALAIDASGDVCVTGETYNEGGNYDCVTIKYRHNGRRLWVRRYNGSADQNDCMYDLGIDGSGNVYVAGVSKKSAGDYDFLIVKYDPAGARLWLRRYDGPGRDDDFAEAIAVDNNGSVLVTGGSYGSSGNLDYATIKYSSSGTKQWVRRYNGRGDQNDYPTAVAVDQVRNVYVTGRAEDTGGDYDAVTIKYSSTGRRRWVRRLNLPDDAESAMWGIALDQSQNVYVTGRIREQIGTVKYSPAGVRLWQRLHKETSTGYDAGDDIIVDANNNVYVSGETNPAYLKPDIMTIKYTQQ